MTGCEGRCGMDLDCQGREQVPWFQRGDGPEHTPRRCALIRATRSAVEDAFPHWEVVIDPGPSGQAFIIVRLRFETDTVVYGAQYALMDGPTAQADAEQRAEWAVRGLNAQTMQILPEGDQTLRA